MIPYLRSCFASVSADLDRSHSVKVALADLEDPVSLPDSKHEPAALNYTVKTPHFSLMKQRKVESAGRTQRSSSRRHGRDKTHGHKSKNCPRLKRKSSLAWPGGSQKNPNN